MIAGRLIFSPAKKWEALVGFSRLPAGLRPTTVSIGDDEVGEPYPAIAGPESVIAHRGQKDELNCVVANDGRRLWGLRNGDNEDTTLPTLGGLSNKLLLVKKR